MSRPLGDQSAKILGLAAFDCGGFAAFHRRLVSIPRSARCRYRLASFRLPVHCSFHVSLHFPQRQGLRSVQNLFKASDVLAVSV